jgi:uncharacterized repeat protein (TIGR03803 family)
VTILHSFDYATGDGAVPRDSLVADSTHIYGMTYSGGGPQGDGSGGGVIFKSKMDGSDYTILHRFGGYEVNDGSYPWGSLVLSGSTLYGMTQMGSSGEQNMGTIFRIGTDGSNYAVLHSFGDGTIPHDGARPLGSLILSGSTLYGMTNDGGAGSACYGYSCWAGGTVFKIDTDGTDYSVLHSFHDGTVDNDGCWPEGSLVLSGSTLYGFNWGCGVDYHGTVFKIDTDGTDYSILHRFMDGTVENDGSRPYGSPMLSGSTLYGVTFAGGGDTGGHGTIFRLNTDGSDYTILHSVDGDPVSGTSNPRGSLVLYESTLYGMTDDQNTYSNSEEDRVGSIYKIGTTGADFTILHKFGDGTVENDGARPTGSLILSGSTFYGMTQYGGEQDSGTIFSLSLPDVPTGVTAAPGNALATVSFTAPEEKDENPITSYTVTSSPGGNESTGSKSPIIVTGLANGTSYTFTVKATNEVGTGGASGASNSVIPHTPPGPPTGVAATAGNGAATVTFTAPASNGGSPITGYTVTSSPGGIVKTGPVSPITVTGLTNGTSYTFTVTATNMVGSGPASIASNSVIPLGPPGAPTGVVAMAGNGEVTVGFTAPASNGGSPITGYTVTSSPGGIVKTGPASPITVTGLTNGISYTFTVTATNAIGPGPASNASNSVTPATVPGAPTMGTATAGDGQATVSFTPPASNGGSAITGYTVTSSPGGIEKTGTVSPITVTGLINGTTYTFTVTAANAIGSGPASNASNSVTPATVPGAPTMGTAIAGDGQATVSFTPPASNGGSPITGYTVTSSPGGIEKTGTVSPITVTGLINGTTYTFTVKATNAIGTGPVSNASNSVMPQGPPGAPTGVAATAGNGQAKVSFIPPTSNGESAITGYTVISNPDGIVGTGAASPITVKGLANGTTYTFTVQAQNAVALGPPSAPSNSVTPLGRPGAPTGVEAKAWNARATVAFNAPASDGGAPISSYVVISSPEGIIAHGTTSPITVKGLTNGRTYTFTVKAKNSKGFGPASTPSNSVTPVGRPGAPTGVKAKAGNARATVTFTPPASDGGAPITSYTVISKPGGIAKRGSASPITVKGLTNGTAYTFTVKAKNSSGLGPASSPSNSVTPNP